MGSTVANGKNCGVSLGCLSDDVLARILHYAHPKHALKLWVCGDSLLHAKLGRSSIQQLSYRAPKVCRARPPLLLRHFRGLRSLALLMGAMHTFDHEEFYAFLLELPPSLEKLLLQPRIPFFSIARLAASSRFSRLDTLSFQFNSPVYVTPQDFQTLPSTLQQLHITGSIWASNLAELISALPLTLQSLHLHASKALPDNNQDNGPGFFDLAPNDPALWTGDSVRALPRTLTVLQWNISHRMFTECIEELPPSITSLEIPEPKANPTYLRKLPAALSSLALSRAPALLEDMYHLPSMLTVLAIPPPVLVSGDMLASLPRTLTMLKAKTIDWSTVTSHIMFPPDITELSSKIPGEFVFKLLPRKLHDVSLFMKDDSLDDLAPIKSFVDLPSTLKQLYVGPLDPADRTVLAEASITLPRGLENLLIQGPSGGDYHAFFHDLPSGLKHLHLLIGNPRRNAAILQHVDALPSHLVMLDICVSFDVMDASFFALLPGSLKIFECENSAVYYSLDDIASLPRGLSELRLQLPDKESRGTVTPDALVLDVLPPSLQHLVLRGAVINDDDLIHLPRSLRYMHDITLQVEKEESLQHLPPSLLRYVHRTTTSATRSPDPGSMYLNLPITLDSMSND